MREKKPIHKQWWFWLILIIDVNEKGKKHDAKVTNISDITW